MTTDPLGAAAQPRPARQALQPLVLQVGFPFPYDLIDDAAWWETANNSLVFSAPGLSDVDEDDLTVQQLWLAAHGPMVGLLLRTSQFSVEAVGVRAAGQSLPDWVAREGEGHLMITVVWVDDIGKIIVRMQAFTLPPKVARILIERARQAWETPVSRSDVIRAQRDWQDRFPNEDAFMDRALATYTLPARTDPPFPGVAVMTS